MEVRYVTDRCDTLCAKYRQEYRDNPDYLYCGVADMDLAPPEPVMEAMKQRLDHGVLGYTELPDGYEKLVSDWMREQYHCDVEQEWVLFSPRINMALNMAVDTFTEPGDSIIVNTPAYPALTGAVEKWGRNLKESPLILKNGRFTIDFDGLERLADQGTRAYILCNPHNPTGRVWTAEELSGVISFCKRHDLLLLSDDIHGDFVWPGHVYRPLLTMYDNPEQEKVIVFNSLTKTLNVPGLIFSNIILPNPKMRCAMAETIDRWGLHNPNVFAADILNPAYRECGEWVGRMRAQVYENIKTAREFISRELPWLDACMPDGTYLMWIGYKRTGLSEEDMRRLLEEKGRLVPLMGTHFKEAGRGYFRLNMGTSGEQVKEILKRLALCWT